MKIVIVKSTRYDTIEKHQSSLLFIPSRIQFYSAICPVVSSIKAFSGSQMLILKWLPKPFLEVSSLSRRFCLIKTLIKAPRGPARTPDLERSMIQIWFKPSFHMDSPAILKPPKILQFFHVFPIFFLLPTSTTPIRLSACCRLCRILDFNSTRCDWAASTSVTEGGRIMKAPRDGWDDPTETFDVMVCFFWGKYGKIICTSPGLKPVHPKIQWFMDVHSSFIPKWSGILYGLIMFDPYPYWVYRVFGG